MGKLNKKDYYIISVLLLGLLIFISISYFQNKKEITNPIKLNAKHKGSSCSHILCFIEIQYSYLDITYKDILTLDKQVKRNMLPLELDDIDSIVIVIDSLNPEICKINDPRFKK